MTETLGEDLTEVRNRFQAADIRLGELLDSLEELRKSSDRFDAAKDGFEATNESLLRMSGQLGRSADSMSMAVGMLDRAIAALQMSDMGLVREELTRIEGKSSAHALETREALALHAGRIADQQAANTEALQSLIDGARVSINEGLQGLLTGFKSAEARQRELESSVGALTTALATSNETLASLRRQMASYSRRALITIIAVGAVTVAAVLIKTA